MPGIDLRFARQPPITVVVAILFGLSWAGADKGARASTFTSLYSFCKQQSCTDGQAPASGLTIDSHGHLFGATIVGGANGDGVVFELLPNNDGTWKEKVLYSFCSFANCSDGASPFGPPILDTSGNLYGTTGGGGSAERGVVFELQKNQNTWTYIVRYNFCGSGGNCDDGYVPTGWLTYVGQDAGAPWNGSSPLFGVASAGGVYHVGVAYRLMPGASWTQDVIHNFHTASTPSPLAAKSNGDLFGTALVGAKYGGGLLYKLTNNTWQQTFLHNFCNMPNCTDGQSPIGGVTIDGSGNLFGATMSGGAFDKGVAFEHHVGGGYNVIYHFCSLNNCSDGSGPEAGMVLDGSGNLYGTTVTGGKFNHGVLFKLHKDTFAQTVLYDFCKKANCVDGSSPLAVISDGAGHLFGVTRNGGKHNDGTVYQFTP